MSIPKEPRQLMINLMYLVLTAMLALNVSAEVINAFFKIDKGLETTNGIVDQANLGVVAAMEEATKERPNDKPLVDLAKEVQVIAKDFQTYVDGVRDRLVSMAGGRFITEEQKASGAEGSVTTDPKKLGKPVKYKDKEIPQRLFVQGHDGKSGGLAGQEAAFDPEGPVFKKKIEETREKFTALLTKAKGVSKLIKDDEIEDLIKNLALTIEEPTDDKTWEASTFGYMPVAGVYPLLRKFQTDAKNAESAVINYLASKIGGTVIKFDTFEPVASAEKGYILKGETFKSDIFLSAYSKQAKVSISVNGRSLPVKDGKAVFTAKPSSYGEQSYTASISLKNPFTGESQTFKKTFKYEVGESSAAVSLDKMNVFYIGVDNPVSVSVAGVSSNKVKVTGSGVSLSGSGGKYTVTASRPGKASLTVRGGSVNKTFEYRVKRIPDPIARLGKKDSGSIGSGEFKAQGGVGAWLDNFDFEAKCKIQGFMMTRVEKRKDPVDAPNSGARFSGRSADLVARAKPGDTYYFDNIKARCPGDPAARKINSLVFKIR